MNIRVSSNMSNLKVSSSSLSGWKRSRLITTLAYKDLLFDRKIAFCIVFALVSVIAPLMLLFGLKNGIVTQLNTKLLSDPRNIEIVVLGNKNHPLTWIETIQKRDDVQFVIPQTRSLNTQADLFHTKALFAENIEMIPTAKGDPLLGHLSQDLAVDEIILTKPLADKLDIKVNDKITVFVSRKRDNQFERAKRTVTVKGILETAYFTRPAGFISLSHLVDMEDYRDGFAVAALGGKEGQAPTPRTHFAKFRLYAANIDLVGPLANWLNTNHIETQTKQAEIENVKAISYVLSFIFGVIAWITFLGCAASLTGAFLANIDRKRKDMAIMRLIGFKKRAVTAYIMIQSVMLTSLAYLIACGLYGIGSHLFNQALGGALPENQFASHLTFIHYVIAFCLAFLIALLVAALGALRASRIEPAESLREI